LEFLDGGVECRACPEFLDKLERCSHRVERRNLQDSRVTQIDDALILVFLQQCLQHGARLGTIFCEDIALAHVVGPLAAGEGRLVKGDVADEIEGIQILADFLGKRVEG